MATPHGYSDAEVVGLIERMEAGRSKEHGMPFDHDAQMAATELTSWMAPHAHNLLCRLMPTLRGSMKRAEIESYVWMFLSSTSLNPYLAYRHDEGPEKPLQSPKLYLCGRRSLLATFFRRIAIKYGEFGQSVKSQWQDRENTRRTINRMCQEGRLTEYERIAIDGDTEVWRRLSSGDQSKARAYHDRRFLSFRHALSERCTIGATELRKETQLLQAASIGKRHSENNDFGSDMVQPFRVEKLPRWIESIFEEVRFPLRGTTILGLRVSTQQLWTAHARENDDE